MSVCQGKNKYCTAFSSTCSTCLIQPLNMGKGEDNLEDAAADNEEVEESLTVMYLKMSCYSHMSYFGQMSMILILVVLVYRDHHL